MLSRWSEYRDQSTCFLLALLIKLEPEETARHDVMPVSLTVSENEMIPSIACMASFETVRNGPLRHLLIWWVEKRGERLMPAICDIDPLEIRSSLAQVWLCDYLPECGRLRYRLAGEEINDFWGYNLAGKFLDEVIPAERRASVTQKSCMVVDLPAITHDRTRLSLTEDFVRTGERLILPLSDDGRTVNALLGATHRNWFRDLEFDPFSTYSETTTIAALHSDVPMH